MTKNRKEQRKAPLTLDGLAKQVKALRSIINEQATTHSSHVNWLSTAVETLLELNPLVNGVVVEDAVNKKLGLVAIKNGEDVLEGDNLVITISAYCSETGVVVPQLCTNKYSFDIGKKQILPFVETFLKQNPYGTTEKFTLTQADQVFQDEAIPSNLTLSFVFNKGTRSIEMGERYVQWFANLRTQLLLQLEYLPTAPDLSGYTHSIELRKAIDAIHETEHSARTQWYMNTVKELNADFDVNAADLTALITEAVRLRTTTPAEETTVNTTQNDTGAEAQV